MVVRLLLALLVALLPLPAAASGAACHDGGAPVAQSVHGSEHRPQVPDHGGAEQFCLGCVAPSTLRAPVLEAPILPAGTPVIVHIADGRARVGPPPATPPPRLQS